MYGYFFDNIPRHEMFDLKLFKNVFDVFPSVQKKKKKLYQSIYNFISSL